MASKNMMVLLAALVAVVLLTDVAVATVFMVGDDKGWTNNVNYTKWAAGKTFFVGDSLVFKYPEGRHTVYKASAQNFTACEVPTNGNPFNTGNDTIKLSTVGKKWYICGVKGHCDMGQKLVITVLDSSAPVPAPSATPPSSRAATISAYASMMAAALMVVLMSVFY